MSPNDCKSIVVLGSTGSVGTQTLDVVRSMPDRFRVVGLAAHGRWRELADQVREFDASVAALCDESACRRFAEQINGMDVELLTGDNALSELAGRGGVDIVVSAVTGNVGLPAAVAALESGAALALANKEAVVMGGPLLSELADANGAMILPVDSEHSAVFQLLSDVDLDEVESVVLTASGGPFLGRSTEEMAAVLPEEALRHPTWSMGPKISVDSANLMNKAQEVIEARWLFGLEPDRIEVMIHPQSIVHAMVRMADGSVICHMSAPDMRVPIKYALGYPRRLSGGVRTLDLAEAGRLEFARPDMEAFPALRLGYRVAGLGGTSGAVLSAANEAAVWAFLDGRIGFMDIVTVVEKVLDRHDLVETPSVDELIAADRWAREEAARCLRLF